MPDEADSSLEPLPHVNPKILELAQLNSTFELLFNHHDKPMVIRACSLKDQDTSDPAVLFGLWNRSPSENLEVPVGCFYGTEHSVLGRKIVYAGSRPKLAELAKADKVLTPNFIQFDSLSGKHASNSAFEIAPQYRDGQLSHKFLAIILGALKARGVSTISLSDDKTIKPDGTSFYTQYAFGETYNGRTKIDTNLSPQYQSFLHEVLG